MIGKYYDERYENIQENIPHMSIDQMSDLMRVVVSMGDLDVNSVTYESDVYFLLNYVCGEWYDVNDDTYQRMCYEYLKTLPFNPLIEKALDFFSNDDRYDVYLEKLVFKRSKSHR